MIPITKNDPPGTSVAHGCSDTGEVPPPEATTSIAGGSGGAALPVTSHEGAVGTNTNTASVGVVIPAHPPTYPPNSSPRPRSYSGPKFSARLSSSPESLPGDASRAPTNYMAARPRPRRSLTSHDAPGKLIPQGGSSNREFTLSGCVSAPGACTEDVAAVRASGDEQVESSSEDEDEGQAERSGDEIVVGVGQWDVLEKGEGKRHWKGTKSGTRERREVV